MKKKYFYLNYRWESNIFDIINLSRLECTRTGAMHFSTSFYRFSYPVTFLALCFSHFHPHFSLSSFLFLLPSLSFLSFFFFFFRFKRRSHVISHICTRVFPTLYTCIHFRTERRRWKERGGWRKIGDIREKEREGEDRGRNGRVGVMHKIVYIRVNARHLAGWRGRKGSNEWTSERFRFGSVRSSLV